MTSSSPSKDSFHAGWGSVGNRSGTGSNSQLDRLDENEAYVPPSWKGAGLGGIANGDLRYEYQHREQAVDPSWYQDPEENCETTSPSSQPGQDPVRNGDRVVQAHSQDSAVGHRISLQSTGGEESHSQPAWDEGRSADLGVVRIKKKHSKKSLEMLTRYIGLPAGLVSGICDSPSLSPTLSLSPSQSVDYVGSTGHAENTQRRCDWSEQQGTQLRECGGRVWNRLTEKLSGTERTHKHHTHCKSATLCEYTGRDVYVCVCMCVSSEVTSSHLISVLHTQPGAMDTPTATPTHKQGSEVRVRKAARSYSSQRQQLHKSRSRGGDDQAATKRGGCGYM